VETQKRWIEIFKSKGIHEITDINSKKVLGIRNFGRQRLLALSKLVKPYGIDLEEKPDRKIPSSKKGVMHKIAIHQASLDYQKAEVEFWTNIAIDRGYIGKETHQ
jgi:hypothetical protein